MRSSLIRLVCCFILALQIVSCSVDHRDTGSAQVTAPVEEHEGEWTILYYGAGNHSLDMLPGGLSQTMETIHGLQDVFRTDAVHVVGLAGTELDNGQCRFYDIRFRPGEAGNRVSSSASDWGRQDMSSPQLLKQFVDTATVMFPARHYALIIGGQGGAWRGACRDDGHGGRVMSMPAIYQSLDASTNHTGLPVHFDVLLWLTPGMGTMEVAYEMRGKADYMVATSSSLAQPGFLASGRWLLDLASDPDMSGERLGRFMVARMAEQAQSAHDTLATFNLLDLRQTESLARQFSILADSLRPAVEGNSAQILQIWQSLWDLRTGDSAAIDLPAFVETLRTDSSFNSRDGIRQAADHVHDALDQMLIDRRSTRTGNLRRGLTIYSPMVLLPPDLESYHALQMSTDQPGWASLLAAMQESGTALVRASGSIRWTGHTVQDVYLFLNTAQVGVPEISLVAPAGIRGTVTPDHVLYESTLALNGDSVSAYLGVFQDLDHNQQLSSGDRFGYYHVQTGSRDWITLHGGDRLDSLDVDLTRTY
jgi:hypothetical protein